jgi:hypothetical protein
MEELKYTIENELAVLSKNDKGWQKELNLVKWGDNPAKYDIRMWGPDHTKMGKGITLGSEELNELASYLKNNSIK